METKHTPGKWVIATDLSKDDTPTIRCTGHNEAVCYLAINRHLGELGPSAQESANAALIAQAPDLLAERDRLRHVNAELVAALETIANSTCDHGPGFCARESASAALAKAKGE